MTSIEHVKQTFRRLQWKLTLSYTAVTVGTLLVVVFILGFLLFSWVLVPLDILNSVLTPQGWIQAVNDNLLPQWGYILSQEPIDTGLISLMMQQDENLQVTYFDLFRVGDLQIRLRTTGQMSIVLVDPDGIVLGTSNPNFVPEQAVGQPLDMGILPGLQEPLETAKSGELDPERLFVSIEPNERFYFTVPYLDEADQHVLGVGILYIESLPTENDLPANILTLVSRSVLILLLAAGLIGTLFGALTANGMVKRLRRVSRVTDAWCCVQTV